MKRKLAGVLRPPARTFGPLTPRAQAENLLGRPLRATERAVVLGALWARDSDNLGVEENGQVNALTWGYLLNAHGLSAEDKSKPPNRGRLNYPKAVHMAIFRGLSMRGRALALSGRLPLAAARYAYRLDEVRQDALYDLLEELGISQEELIVICQAHERQQIQSAFLWTEVARLVVGR